MYYGASVKIKTLRPAFVQCLCFTKLKKSFKQFIKKNVLRKLIISYRQYPEFYRHNQNFD